MAAAFAYGLYNHFIAAGADNVAQVASAGWALVFRATAVSLALLEAGGVAMALPMARATLTTPLGPPGPRG